MSFLSISIQNEYEKEIANEIYIEKIPIVALNNVTLSNGQHSGSIFVQTGSYNQDMYYQLMIKNENDGKMKYIKLKADDTYIYEYSEDSNETPHIEIEWEVKKVYGEIVEPEKLSERLRVNTDYFGFSDIIAPINNISIHVPEGTVDRSMSVEFQ